MGIILGIMCLILGIGVYRLAEISEEMKKMNETKWKAEVFTREEREKFEEELSNFRKSRDEAFQAFVLHDDWGAVLKHLEKYEMSFPAGMDETVKKASVLKTVHECTEIPDEVKKIADKKCIQMGFKPGLHRL